MSMRTVRLDEKAERALAALATYTGLSVSEVLKRGLFNLHDQLLAQTPKRPYDIYAALDIGEENTAVGASDDVKNAVRAAIRRKHKR